MFTVALLGKPNVGKSSLFNSFVYRRDAIVSDQPGLTRDRRYGAVSHHGRHWLLIDTGGLFSAQSELDRQVEKQTDCAIEEADLLLLVVSARDGLTALDELIADKLRRINKPIHLIVNKIDGLERHTAEAQFAGLGLSRVFATSATHRLGVREVLADIGRQLPAQDTQTQHDPQLPRIAMLGRPNSGKSTLFNRLLGQERAISSPVPGTTRDSIEMSFEYKGRSLILVDTAGLRRRRKVSSEVEKIAAIKSLYRALATDVVILMCGADEGLGSQDVALAGRVLDAGRSLVLACNKWDLLNREAQGQLQDSLERKFPFAGIDVCRLSALRGDGVDALMTAVLRAWQAGGLRVSAAQCNRLLQAAVRRHHPDSPPRRQPKLRYIHQGGVRPPLFVVHGSRLDHLSSGYRRYLENFFRRELKLRGTAIAFRFRNKDNPYIDSK